MNVASRVKKKPVQSALNQNSMLRPPDCNSYGCRKISAPVVVYGISDLTSVNTFS